MDGPCDVLKWDHLSPVGRECPTIRELIDEKLKRRRQFLAANSPPKPRKRETRPAKPFRHERILRAALTDVISSATLLKEFPRLIPPRPYCTDRLEGGVYIRSAAVALQCRHIQLNGPTLQVWMTFDIDRQDAHAAYAGLAIPNYTAINPENGHAHIGYLLKVPIFKHARSGPLIFAADVERGLQRRLGADPAYCGLMTKNPLHEAWHVNWIAPQPYLLADLAAPLTRADMAPGKRCQTLSTGLGRNVAVFDETRYWSYRNILAFKRNDVTRESWIDRCNVYAQMCNAQLATPLPPYEVRSIAKSIAKWTWEHFNTARFSAIQSQRAQHRWKDHPTKPWSTLGVSKATYYRRRKNGLLRL